MTISTDDADFDAEIKSAIVTKTGVTDSVTPVFAVEETKKELFAAGYDTIFKMGQTWVSRVSEKGENQSHIAK